MRESQGWKSRRVKSEIKLVRLQKKEKFITPMLYDILSCVTPHPHYTSITKIIKKYLPEDQAIYQDKIGNLIVKVGKNYTTMFSCHIDMIFRQGYYDKELPKKLDLFVAQDQENSDANYIWGGVITDKKKGSYIYTPTTLGADDKAGIFILLNLIRAKVPGLYLFHVGEEIGGIGSTDISTRKPKLVKGIKRAVAFDREAYLDIINRQRGGMCCSFKFVNALATQLNDLVTTPNQLPGKYSSATGTFTDTANYIDLIPECTNISVGYFSQHTSGEHLDTLWLEEVLMPAILKVDWVDLPTERSITKSKPWQWNKYTTEPVGKYTTYAGIDYSTPASKLPPWTLKKGAIKSCTDTGMRRLIKEYLDTTVGSFHIQSDICDLLRENASLKEKLADKKTTPAAIVPIRKEGPQEKQKELFDTLTSLLNQHFKISKDNFTLYTDEISGHAEILEWAWRDLSKKEQPPLLSMGQVFTAMREVLSEITVINTTLIADISGNKHYYSPWANKMGISGEKEIQDVILQSMAFFRVNWCALGFDTFASVQDDLKQIRDKIATAS